jgi:hypothetical protein
MSSQANVYTTVNNQVWYTDKCQLSAGNTAITYQVTLAPGFTDTIYSAPAQLPPYNQDWIYVGVGNKLTITGSNFTATEAGTASSGTAGVSGGGA